MRPYRGDHREIAELMVGQSCVVRRPADVTVAKHARHVLNAITHLGRSRKMAFTTRTNKRTGHVTVRRDETDANGFRLSREEIIRRLDRIVPSKGV